jgi:nitroimidazol reductase NimA-like FMN-containing flavoprotein (pyridoxamine 5'-phosphate oxidase superfamily)
MMNQAERREFVQENRFCIWGYNRRDHGPAMTPGYYTMRGNELCYISMMARAKTKAALRDPRASVCVLDEQRPPSYVQIFGRVRVEQDLDIVYDIFLGVIEAEMIVEGNTFSEEEAAAKKAETIAWLEDEDRIALCLTPESTFYSPPTRGKTLDDKYEYRRSLGDLEEGSIRVGTAMPW